MSCNPGSPCYSSGNTTLSKHCGVDPCYTYKTNTDNVFYNGGNLPCTGVSTCDSLTTVLQKIDDKLCPENLALAVLNIILNDSNLLNQFCTVASNCLSTTTTTTTEAPTFIQVSPSNEGSLFGIAMQRLYGNNPDELNFSLQVNRYSTTNCTGGSGSYSISTPLDPDDDYKFAGLTSKDPASQSAKIVSLSVNDIPITSNPQIITVGSKTYIIGGYNQCNTIS